MPCWVVDHPPDTHWSNGRCGPPVHERGAHRFRRIKVPRRPGTVLTVVRAEVGFKGPDNALVPSQWGEGGRTSTARLQVHACPTHAARLALPTRRAAGTVFSIQYKSTRITRVLVRLTGVPGWLIGEFWGGIAPYVDTRSTCEREPFPPRKM